MSEEEKEISDVTDEEMEMAKIVGEPDPENEGDKIEYHTIAVRKGSVADRYLTKMTEVHVLTYPEAIEQLIIEFDPDLDFLTFEGEK